MSRSLRKLARFFQRRVLLIFHALALAKLVTPTAADAVPACYSCAVAASFLFKCYNKGLRRRIYYVTGIRQPAGASDRGRASNRVQNSLGRYLSTESERRFMVSLHASSSSSSPSLRQRLLYDDYKSYGSLLMSNSPIVAELMAGMGYSHLIIDHEHSPTDIGSGQILLQAIRSGAMSSSSSPFFPSSPPSPPPPTEPIIRVPSSDSVYIKKALDSLRLPGGILIPMIESESEASDVVRAVRYPGYQADGGIRGCAIPFVRASRWGTDEGGSDAFLEKTAKDLLVIAQVETPAAIDQIEEIASVDGIDMIFVGPYDLSVSLGKMGQFDDPEVKALVNRAETEVVKSGCLLGGFRIPGRNLDEMFDEIGYSLVTGSVDLGLLRDSARKEVADAMDSMSRPF